MWLTSIACFCVLIVPSVAVHNLHALRYLEQFGYLPKLTGGASALLSETVIEEALRELQLYGKIPVTGRMDNATRELMSRKRCGMPDRLISHRLRHRRRFARFASSDRKWEKHSLTFSVDNPSRSVRELGAVRREAIEAISQWQRASPLQFTEVRPEGNADIHIRFAVGHHGDAYSFDGTGRILAHAFPPGDGDGGDVHLDDDEQWTLALTGDPYSNQVSLRAILLHELGHSLGLSHSQQPDSIMYSFYQYDLPPALSYDDVVAIQSLYGRGNARPPERPDFWPTPSTTTTRAPLPTHPPFYPMAPESPTRDDTTRSPVPDPCTSDFDAVTTIRQELFVFKSEWFWRIHRDGTLGERPRLISSFWRSLPYPIDAAVENDHHILFFVGSKYYIYDGHRQIASHSLTHLGLPGRVHRIRLVYAWNYWTEKPIYLWTDNEFWRVDKRSGKVELGYPRRISSTWHNVPPTASAAVTFKHDLYFFSGSSAQKFHSVNMTASAAFPTQSLWHHCPNAFAMSRSGGTSITAGDFVPFCLLLFPVISILKYWTIY